MFKNQDLQKPGLVPEVLDRLIPEEHVEFRGYAQTFVKGGETVEDIQKRLHIKGTVRKALAGGKSDV